MSLFHFLQTKIADVCHLFPSLLSVELDRSNSPSTRDKLSLVVKPLSTTQCAAVIAQLEATRVAAQPPGLDPSVDPKLMAMIQGYFPAWKFTLNLLMGG